MQFAVYLLFMVSVAVGWLTRMALGL